MGLQLGFNRFKKDWQTGFYNALRPLLSRYSASANWTQNDAFHAYETIERQVEEEKPELPYTQLLREAYTRLEATLAAESGGSNVDDDDREKFANSLKTLSFPVFPDTCDALRALAQRYKLVVLSNVDKALFPYTLALLSEGSSISSNSEDDMLALYSPNHSESSRDANSKSRFWHPQTVAGSKSPFTMIVTAEDVGAYKPAKKGFLTVLDCIRDDPDLLGSGDDASAKAKLLWVAVSLRHDIAPTREMGIENVWIDRQKLGPEVEGPKWTWRFETLAEFAEAVEQDFAQLES